MDKPIERELKILISQEDMNTIIQSYPFSQPWMQTNAYYDDINNTVKNKGGAVRIRTINDKHIFTLKIRKDEITHYEYEKEIDTDQFENITDPEIKEWLRTYDIPFNLRKIVSFTTIRRIYSFEDAELCADITEYETHKDYELEYEYHRNHEGISEFNQILAKIGIKYEKNCPSKIARAFKTYE